MQKLDVHTLEHYSPLKETIILTHAVTQMNINNIIVSEIIQLEKMINNYTCMSYLEWSN